MIGVTTADNIGLHVKNIYAEKELEEAATTEEFSVVQNEGGRAVRCTPKHYSLDAIIADRTVQAGKALEQAERQLEGKGRGKKK